MIIRSSLTRKAEVLRWLWTCKTPICIVRTLSKNVYRRGVIVNICFITACDLSWRLTTYRFFIIKTTKLLEFGRFGCCKVLPRVKGLDMIKKIWRQRLIITIPSNAIFLMFFRPLEGIDFLYKCQPDWSDFERKGAMASHVWWHLGMLTNWQEWLIFQQMFIQRW